jgi:nucleoside-diphosphate-sugar epimerase
MAKVLVTGASGFIGTCLTEMLRRRGDEVRCLVRKTSRVERLRELGAGLVYGDITDLDSVRAALPGIEFVYHLAGCIMAVRSETFRRVNHGGATNIGRACAEQSRPPVLVSVSSLAAAGPSPDGRLLSETDRPVPVSEYGRSKRAAELALEQYAHRVPITVVRPPIVFGQGDRVTLAMFQPIERFGIHLVPSLAQWRYSLIHVDDLVNLLLRAAERGTRLRPPGSDGAAEHRGYYFAAGESHPTYAELGQLIGALMGRRSVAVIPLARPLIWIVAGGVEMASRLCHRPFILNCDKAREATAGSWACSSRRASEELRFSVAAPLAERLRQTISWYREHQWLNGLSLFGQAAHPQ